VSELPDEHVTYGDSFAAEVLGPLIGLLCDPVYVQVG